MCSVSHLSTSYMSFQICGNSTNCTHEISALYCVQVPLQFLKVKNEAGVWNFYYYTGLYFVINRVDLTFHHSREGNLTDLPKIVFQRGRENKCVNWAWRSRVRIGCCHLHSTEPNPFPKPVTHRGQFL